MHEVYASLLLHSAKQPITVENLTKVLQSTNITPDEGKLKALVTALEGQDIDKLIQEASIAVPTVKAEEKKEEKEEKKMEEAAAGLSQLFA